MEQFNPVTPSKRVVFECHMPRGKRFAALFFIVVVDFCLSECVLGGCFCPKSSVTPYMVYGIKR